MLPRPSASAAATSRGERFFVSQLSMPLRIAGAAGCIYFGGCALFYVWTALCAIVNFSWRQPIFDQWRMYQHLLTLPFPSNVLQLENGHRPVIPNLIRLAEVHWFAADQRLQLSIGIACAMVASSTLALLVCRQKDFTFTARAAGIMLAVLGIFWLANARILMHGNEALHAYLLIVSVIAAARFMFHAARVSSVLPLLGAAAAGTIATFCFGPGIAAFPAVLVLGILLRVSWLRLSVVAIALVSCLAVYLFALPNDEQVRGMLDLHPLKTAAAAMTWISSPWAIGWLGLADPPLYPFVAKSMSDSVVSRSVIGTANAIVSSSHLSWRTLSMVIGCIGTAVFVVRTLIKFAGKQAWSSLESVATMLCLFALATAVVIGIGRLDYFAQYPDQLFADRYVIWPCLFWCGLALLLLIDTQTSSRRLVRAFYVASLLVLPVLLWPLHANTAGWSAAVFHNSQRLAAMARSDVVDAQVVAQNTDGIAEYQTTLALFKQQRLAMFADPVWQLFNQLWTGTIETNADIGADVLWLDAFDDAGTPTKRVRAFQGTITHGISKLQGGGHLALLDGDDRVRGFAEFTCIASTADALLLMVPRKRGFDGYAPDDDAEAHYRLVWLEQENGRALVIASLPPVPTP